MATNALTVSERVCLAKAEVGAIPKNGFNKHGGYKHATVDDVYNACRPILAKHGLDLQLDILECELSHVESRDRDGNPKRTTWAHVKARMGFEGETHQHRPFSVPVTGPQTFEIINSYLQKQYLRARFQIETGEYDEEDMTKDNPPAPAQEPRPPDVRWELNEDGRLECVSGDAESEAGQRALYKVLAGALQSDDWTPVTLKAAHEFAQNNAALIGALPEAGRKKIESMWAELPDAETGEVAA